MIAWVLALAQPAEADWARVRQHEARVREVVARVTPAYVFFEGGSGVLISPDGWMLTNHHVAGNDAMHQVHITGGREFSGDVIGYDPLGDVSLMKLREAADLPWAPLGDSDALRIGEPVFAVGNPFLLGSESWEPTVTLGVVTAKDRYKEWYLAAVQTDARINPGNSGGPLVNLAGEVIGINGRIEPRFAARVNTGIGYAIPSNQIRRYLAWMRLGGRVRHGWLDGVTIAAPDDRRFQVAPYGSGVLVAGLTPRSRAAEAGLALGDLVFGIEGFPTLTTNRFHGVIGQFPAGSRATIRYRRQGQEGTWTDHEGQAVLGAADEPVQAQNHFQGKEFGFHPSVGYEGPGLRVETPTLEGLQHGDVVLEVDGRPIGEFIDLVGVLLGKSVGDPLAYKVRRGEAELEVVVLLRAVRA